MESQSSKIVRKPEVLVLIGLSNTSFYRQINQGLLPPPISLGCRAVGWYEHEILSVIKARAAGHDSEQIKLLVSQIVKARNDASAQILR